MKNILAALIMLLSASCTNQSNDNMTKSIINKVCSDLTEHKIFYRIGHDEAHGQVCYMFDIANNNDFVIESLGRDHFIVSYIGTNGDSPQWAVELIKEDDKYSASGILDKDKTSEYSPWFESASACIRYINKSQELPIEKKAINEKRNHRSRTS